MLHNNCAALSDRILKNDFIHQKTLALWALGLIWTSCRSVAAICDNFAKVILKLFKVKCQFVAYV